MPLYDYQCRSCRKVAEVRHGFKETYEEPCAACGGEMARVFNAAPIVFKGSGFYVTDSRKSSGSRKTEKTEKTEVKSESSSESKAETKSETKTETKSESPSELSSSKSDGSSSKPGAAA